MNDVRRTKIVATIGPASRSPEVIRQLFQAGMDVARLNFSHGSHSEHAETVAVLRAVAAELDSPITILQDLQGPKVRVGELPQGQVALDIDDTVMLVPEASSSAQPTGATGFFTIPIDYAFAAGEAGPGTRVLLADGLLALEVVAVQGLALVCKVVEGGILKSRKGVNFPGLTLRMPSLTQKDLVDLAFGQELKVDCVCLSFVRDAEDIQALREALVKLDSRTPILAKIEKPQALDHLEQIVAASDAVMVARGDLGVELSPEKVPMAQKRVIQACNRAGKPVITATQMLESMISEPVPTRAEASDVANAIIDGTDAVMLSGESAVGAYPVRAVQMMDRIAREVESHAHGNTAPRSEPLRVSWAGSAPENSTNTHALGRAANVIEDITSVKGIVLLSASGHTARLVAAERPSSPVIALTPSEKVYHSLNLVWGIKPVLVREMADTFDQLVALAERTVKARAFAHPGEKLLIIGGVPAHAPKGSNFLKLHVVS
jgi:pyruvate kinase